MPQTDHKKSAASGPHVGMENILKKTLPGSGILALALIFYMVVVPGQSSSKETNDFYIADEIAIDGPALFYAVSQDIRQELWAVQCAQPLRGCVARAPGLVLRIDDNFEPWLLSVSQPNARVSLQSRNYTKDIPHLFTRALSDDLIHSLSDEKSFVVLEENGRVIQRTRTTGLDQVVDYLKWINGNTGRTLRDARLWPRNEDIRIQDMSEEVLERYAVMQRRALERQRQLVPATKPQVEFAIRAQEGTSFYSSTGQSGY